MSSEINGSGEQVAAKYSKPAIKEATSKRLYEYIGDRTRETGKRVTADEAINELLDYAEHARLYGQLPNTRDRERTSR
jgi:succinyl-CoA synthetase alpha subunit